MQRICYGKNTPTSFLEQLSFSAECPYCIRRKDFQNEDATPLHYADTIEIGVCCHVAGMLTVGGVQRELHGDLVYVVPPGVVHAVIFHQGNGCVYILQVSPSALKDVLNIEQLFRQSGKSIAAIPTVCGEFSPIQQLVDEMIRRDEEPVTRIRLLLEIFEVLASQTGTETAVCSADYSSQNAELRRVIQWTEANFSKSIRLEQAASVVGFSRNYFCSWFRCHTGSTYMQYLCSVRLHHARRTLLRTGSIERACYDSGFRDMSYFIQAFRKVQGCTPKKYLQNFSRPPKT